METARIIVYVIFAICAIALIFGVALFLIEDQKTSDENESVAKRACENKGGEFYWDFSSWRCEKDGKIYDLDLIDGRIIFYELEGRTEI